MLSFRQSCQVWELAVRFSSTDRDVEAMIGSEVRDQSHLPRKHDSRSPFSASAENDADVSATEPTRSAEELGKLLSLLTGEPADVPSASSDAERRTLLDRIVATLSKESVSLTFAQLNEVLLLVGAKRLSSEFFDLFFLADDVGHPPRDENRSISVATMKRGIARFRAFALLRFGSFRFAYTKLNSDTTLAGKDGRAPVKELLGTWADAPSERHSRLASRPQPLVNVSPEEDLVPRDSTWHLGYLSVDIAHTEFARVLALEGRASEKTLESSAESLDALPPGVRGRVKGKLAREWPGIIPEVLSEWRSRLPELRERAPALLDAMKKSTQKGLLNTLKYLTWDYLDVYVATSMRERWEFEETFDSVQGVFSRIDSRLNLRFFDPTQSFEPSPVDKGLLESLMLKRARCTLYLSQEADTLGKDSELAATLAQGKPVVVYIPRFADNLVALHQRIERRPLRYFRKRLLEVLADGFLSKEIEKVCDLYKRLDGPAASPGELLAEAFRLSAGLVTTKPLFEIVVPDEESAILDSLGGRDQLARMMTAIEAVFFEKRAEMYLQFHPLALQVHLETGVANGVLVARTLDEAAGLLEALLLNALPFRIGPVTDPGSETRVGTALFETLTANGAKFRVVTDHALLTNSFWSFYLRENS